MFLSIHHRFSNDTWLEDTTDDAGEVEFDLDGLYTVDISVNGNVEEEDISAGQSDDDITISI